MTRKLKVLGLALGAVFALSGMAASSASAEDTFTGPGASYPFTGISHNNKFEITQPVTKVECTTAHFTGTGIPETNLTANATFTGKVNETPHSPTECTATGGTATVHMNSCDFVLTGHTTGSDGGTDATASLICIPPNEIAVTTSLGCTLKFPALEPTSGGVTYTNEAGGKVKIKVTATGITYTSEGFACVLAGIPSEANNADVTGEVIVSSTTGNIAVSTS